MSTYSRQASVAVPPRTDTQRARQLAAAGIAGPVLFVVLVVVQGQLWDVYSHLRHPISGLAAAPNGWIQNVNVALLGVLFVIFAAALHRGIATRPRNIGSVLLAVSGVGLVGAGLFPASDIMANGDAHGAMFLLTIASASTGLIAISRRMAHDPHWRNHATYTAGSGITMIVLFLVVGGLAFPADAPLHGALGLLQRTLVAVWFACIVALAARLLSR